MTTLHPPIRRALLLAATACAVSSAAHAQDVGESFRHDRNVSVTQRPHPEWDAVGVRNGGFLIYPKLTVTAGYDSNIYADPSNSIDDLVLVATGQAVAASQWSRHRLNADISVSRHQYLDNSDESSWTGGLGVDGQLDVTRDFAFAGRLRYDRKVESRFASGTPRGSVIPIVYDASTARLGVARAFNRVRLSASADYGDYNFHAGRSALGAVIGQDFRDYRSTLLQAKIDYAVTPALSTYAVVRYDDRKFDLTPPAVAFDRGSHGGVAAIGAEMDFANLRGTVELGYLDQDFKSGVGADLSEPTYLARLEYFPTQLTSITLDLGRSVGESGLVATPSVLIDSFGVRVDHELLRNLILSAQVSFDDLDYRGIARSDRQTEVTVGGVYKLNRRIGATAQYKHIDLSSSGLAAGVSSKDDRFTVGVQVQY